MTWRKIHLPPSPSGTPEPMPWTDRWNGIYEDSGRPQDFCIYLTLDQTGERTIYFSPVAVEHCAEFFREISYSHEFYECDAPIGGNPLVGSGFPDCLRLLNRDS